MTMSDRIVILDEGQLQQVGTPREVYNRPANLFVAQFIGSPSMNVFDVEYTPTAEGGRFEGEITLEVTGDDLAFLDGVDERPVMLGIRPEHVTASTEPVEGSIRAYVDIIEPLGSHDLLYFTTTRSDDVTMTDGEDDDELTAAADEYKVLIEPESIPESFQRSKEEVYLRFDLDHLHVFDPDSGANLRYQDEPEAEQVRTVAE